jgi:hypothetical protein
MSTQFTWFEDNGAAAGTPLSGATRTEATQCNWKNTDDVSTAYSSSVITAGNNSYTKYQFGGISGTFNQVSDGKWNHVSGVLGAGLTLKGLVTSTYATPATTTNALLVSDLSHTGAVSTGYAVLFSTTGPGGTSGTSTTTSPSWTQYLATQLITSSATSPGNIETVYLQLSYLEN